MKYLGIALLAIVALLTGGCAIGFLVASLAYASLDMLASIAIPVLLGLVIGGICILWIRSLLAGPAAPAPPGPEEPPRGNP